MKLPAGALALAVGLLASPALARADEPAPAAPLAAPPAPGGCTYGWEADVFAATRSSVVRIHNASRDIWGAGFLWQTGREIVTSMAIVEGPSTFEIRFLDGTRGRARLVAGDRDKGVALLRIEGELPPGARPLELGDPASVAQGAPVIAIGHPLAWTDMPASEAGLYTWTLTRGILGGRGDDRIQLDVNANPGNSGGPILDCQGRVIGVALRSVGSLYLAASSRTILALESSPRLPGVHVDPRWTFGVGAGFRFADGTTYVGPSIESGLVLFQRVRLIAQSSLFVSLANDIEEGRVITSRRVAHWYLAAGYGFPITRWLQPTPFVGLAMIVRHESAIAFTADRTVSASRTEGRLRFSPGIVFPELGLGYRFELADNRELAHIVSWLLPLRY